LSIPQITSQRGLPLSSETITSGPTTIGTNGTTNGTGHEPEPRSPGRRRSPEREMALQETRSFLFGRTDPTRIKEIDAHLEVKGIRLNGNDPLNNLSALLSISGGFTAHGRAGWTLTQ
jgi:hypothetical protein